MAVLYLSCPHGASLTPALGGSVASGHKTPRRRRGEAPKQGGQIFGDPLGRGVQTATWGVGLD